MGRWELFSEAAAIIRRHSIVLALAIFPALVATYIVDSILRFHRVLPSQFHLRPLYYASSVLVLQLIQFFLGWLSLTFEFAVVADYISSPIEHRSMSDSVGRMRERLFELAKVSWGIYWRALVAFVPLFALVLFAFTYAVDLYSKLGIWSGDLEAMLALACTALFTSKWLLAVPELTLSKADARGALASVNRELRGLHESILSLALFLVVVSVFGSSVWPRFLRYVYIPASWPDWSVKLIQHWIAPATSILINLWGTMMLFVGASVLWMNREHFKQEEDIDAHPLHR